MQLKRLLVRETTDEQNLIMRSGLKDLNLVIFYCLGKKTKDCRKIGDKSEYLLKTVLTTDFFRHRAALLCGFPVRGES